MKTEPYRVPSCPPGRVIIIASINFCRGDEPLSIRFSAQLLSTFIWTVLQCNFDQIADLGGNICWRFICY